MISHQDVNDLGGEGNKKTVTDGPMRPVASERGSGSLNADENPQSRVADQTEDDWLEQALQVWDWEGGDHVSTG